MTPSQKKWHVIETAVWIVISVAAGLLLLTAMVCAQESAPRISEFTTVEGPLEVGPPPDQYRPIAIPDAGCQCGVCQCERCDCALPKPEKLPVLSNVTVIAPAPVARTRPVQACYGGKCYVPQRKRFLWWRW